MGHLQSQEPHHVCFHFKFNRHGPVVECLRPATAYSPQLVACGCGRRFVCRVRLGTGCFCTLHCHRRWESQILEVIDPSGPLVRVETLAFGSGSPGSLTYRSGDIINLGNGQGSGTNSFTTADGDELFGSFTVQLVPGADPSLFDLIGQMQFTGGTGDFLGASGSATFNAHGQFVSAFEAVTQFAFEGLLARVPEPGTAMLGLLGLLALARSRATGRLGNRTGDALAVRRSPLTA